MLRMWDGRSPLHSLGLEFRPHDPELLHEPRRTTPSVSLGSCCRGTYRYRGNLAPRISSCRSRASGASDTHSYRSATSRHSVGQRLLHILVSSRARKTLRRSFFRSQATRRGAIVRALVRGDVLGHLCSCWRTWSTDPFHVSMRNHSQRCLPLPNLSVKETSRKRAAPCVER